ncbi:AsmA family protein [Salinisphaera aquimarina]|uniref:AsmA family protein n=1 Tax=Salinisphaera aquimarina TaxID=2094031 RepID=A0ABV7ET04_9GAMM
MKRFGKILLVIIGVIVLLVAIAMAALLLFFDPNDYKSQINASIERQIGRKVEISGDIGLSVFPWLGIELGHVEVANAQGFGDKPMAEMESAEISVKLLPLISRDIEVGTVSLDGLRLRLARDAKGRSNWEDISERLSADQNSDIADTQADSPPPAPAETAGGFKLSSLQIGAIEIRDAAVAWQDAQTGADYRVTDVKLSTGRLSDGDPVRLELSGDVAAPEEKINAALNLVTQVEPDIAEQFYRFSGLSLNVLASGEGVPAQRQQATLSGNGELDMAEGRLKLSGVTLQGAGLNISGNLDGTGLNDTPSYSGRITVKNFDPRAVMRELDIDAPATQKKAALSAAGFDAQFSANANRVDFKQILATLDDSSLKGSASVEDFAKPNVVFALNLDKLNVDDYLPPGSAEQAQTDTPAQTGGGDAQKDAEIDLSGLKDLRMDGKLAVGALTAANIHVTNANLTVKARDGVLTIEPLTAELYQGNVRVTARVDASKDTPRYALKGNLNGLQFQPLLEDVADTDRVAALANMNIDISTAGKQVAAMKRALNGNFGFDLRDGAFNGFNLAQVIASARSRLASGGDGGGAGSGVGEDEKTPFNRFAASFNVKDGVMAGKDLNLKSRVINATGTGNYDLAANALDYVVSAQVPEDASGKLEDLAGVAVPIKLTGNLMSPAYSLDVAGALKGVASKRLQDEKAKLQDKVSEKLKERTKKIDPEVSDKVKKGFQGLFGGSKKDDAN